MGSHTYDLLVDQLQDVYCEYGIKIKVIKTTTDSSYNFVKCLAYLLHLKMIGMCA